MTEQQFEALIEYIKEVASSAVHDPYGESQMYRPLEQRLRELLVEPDND